MTLQRIRKNSSRAICGPLARVAAACIVLTPLAGCAVVEVAGAAAGAAISVTGAVVSTGVRVTGKVVEKGIDAVTPGSGS